MLCRCSGNFNIHRSVNDHLTLNNNFSVNENGSFYVHGSLNDIGSINDHCRSLNHNDGSRRIVVITEVTVRRISDDGCGNSYRSDDGERSFQITPSRRSRRMKVLHNRRLLYRSHDRRWSRTRTL